jgi:hypothetical protein
MRLQLIKDGQGNNTGVFVPMNDWEAITQKHQDLKVLLQVEPLPKKKLSALAGSLSKKTAGELIAYVEKSRNEDWTQDFN